MFDFLKKKISGFVDKITGKAEGKPEPVKEAPAKAEAGIGPQPGRGGAKKEGRKAEPAGEEKPEARAGEETAPAKPAQAKRGARKGEEARELPKAVHGPGKRKDGPIAEMVTLDIGKAEIQAPKPEAAAPKLESAGVEPKKDEKKEEKVKLSLITQVKSIFSGEVELSEKDIGSALDDFEMGLLEGDVALEVAEQIKTELRGELVGRKVRKSELQAQISSIFFNSIRKIMAENTGKPLLEQVRAIEARPVSIMFTGPNGSGKTTTIAKIANMLKGGGFSVVIAAADTFRAAAIEQMEIHGAKLGVKVVKGKYGADPTSVAFDAVNHAKAHGIDVVLIDTAGRQETNLNLLNELKKMVRVIKPGIKVYVGESIAGNAVIEQVDTFNKELGLDGVILTKLDCDAKGGTVVSISKVTKVPVLYVTVGQGYGDIEEFDPDRIAGNIAG